MRNVSHGLREGFRGLGRSWGLAVLLLGVNLFLAALVAVPLAGRLERDLDHTAAAAGMMYGFDYDWWSAWWDRQEGHSRTLHPEMLGLGFSLKNLDLLLKGALPARLLSVGGRTDEDDEGARDAGPDGVILGLGVVYLLVQTFLAGGVLGVLRGSQGEWSVRSLLHGSGFYFGRMLRVAAVALLAHFVVFRLNAPFAQWADGRAREAVSETTAIAWLLGRHVLLLAGVLLIHLVSSYAKVIVVLEERASALLAFVSAASFCARHALAACGHYLALLAVAAAWLLAWGAADAAFDVIGYRTQLAALTLGQTFLLGRMGLRVALAGGQIALFRKLEAA